MDWYSVGMIVIAVVSAALAFTRGVPRARQRGLPEEGVRLYLRWAVLLCVVMVSLAVAQLLRTHVGNPAGRGIAAVFSLVGGVSAIASLWAFARLARIVRETAGKGDPHPSSPSPKEGRGGVRPRG